MQDELPQHFFGVEAAAGFEHAVNLAKRVTPLGNVMDDPEIEHRIVGSIRRGDLRHASLPKPDSVAAIAKPLARELDHVRIQIEGVDRSCSKVIQHETRAHTATA